MLKELEEPERKERGTESQKGRGATPQLPARRRRAMQSGRGQRRQRWASRRPAARSSVSSRASAGGEERSLVVTPGRRRLGARGLPRMPPEFWGRPGGREREAAGWSGTPVTTSVQGTRSGGAKCAGARPACCAPGRGVRKAMQHGAALWWGPLPLPTSRKKGAFPAGWRTAPGSHREAKGTCTVPSPASRRPGGRRSSDGPGTLAHARDVAGGEDSES